MRSVGRQGGPGQLPSVRCTGRCWLCRPLRGDMAIGLEIPLEFRWQGEKRPRCGLGREGECR